MAKRALPDEFDPAGFAVFWSKYAKHEAKVDAYKAWRQVQPTVEEQALISAALDWQIPLWGREQFRYAPLAATYLRGRRWEDERRSGVDRRADGSGAAVGGRTGVTPGKYSGISRREA